MKIYNKPELNVEKFDIESVITVSDPNTKTDADDVVWGGGQSAGMEFDIDVNGNEF